MIEITVRTLDSQSHKFSVEDEFTVQQFKQHIASTVNIAAETQRIIYSGRVLTDDAKLSDLDVNGKVVHLVERPPPSDNQSNDQPNAGNAAPPHGHQPRVLGGNAMYLGSMAIPFDHQNLVPPPPTYRLAASRLAVARRMLRRAEATIFLLEHPTAPRSTSTQNDEVQVEVTPVFEARIIVPESSRDNIDENLMNAVQTSLLNSAANVPVDASMNPESGATPQENPEPEATQSASSTPEAASTPLSTSTEDIAGQVPSSNQDANATNQENISRTSEMADLLDTLGRLQVRFAPFLERYQTFMREDPDVEAAEARTLDRTFNHVSHVLHYFSHAYHSLSDMILRVRLAPPRRLVCRPILIQQTAVVPAGFPIQVEAQINFSSDLPMPNSTSSGTQTQTPPNTTNTTTAGSNNAPGSNAGANRTSRVTFPHFELMNIPGAVHVQSIPIGIRTMRSSSQTRTDAGNAGNQNAHAPNQDGNAQQNANAQRGASIGNPNVEFFMEVTPESITIDSLESSLGEAGVRTAVPQPTPEFFQSIMQMAGQFVNRGASTSNISNITVNQRPPSAPASDASSTTTAGSAQATGQNGVPGQNSQARGNTQTHPTTATHTRSTARPHVHFSQHAIQGFDPFLPCNSHHINHLRGRNSRVPTNNNQNQPNNNNVRPQNGNSLVNQINPMLNLVQGMLGSLQNVYARRTGAPPAGAPTAPPAAAPTGSTGTPVVPAEQAVQNLFSRLQNLMMPQNAGASDSNSRGPTIAQLVQQTGEELEGEGLFADLFRLLSQHLSMSDLLHLSTGRLDALLRMRNEIRTFVSDQVLEGNSPTSQNVERAVDKLLSEMQPFIATLSHLTVRDDIDIVRSTQVLFRNRLPNVINLAVSRRPNSMKALIDQLRLIGRHLFGLLLHASVTGPQGVEDVVNRIAVSNMQGISPTVDQWSLMAVRVQLHEFLLTIDVPSSALQQYIVRNVNSILATSSERQDNEPMDVDGEEAATEEEAVSNVLGVIELDDREDMPAVVIGSESWHGQVPPEWVPVIARDTQRQRRQNQAPLSDGYLSGMPSKRRKVVTSNKPQGTLPQVITESIRRAVTTTGHTTAANLDAVSEEAGADLTIQSAYRDLLRTSVQTSIQDNEDFTPDRFPNASSYFSKSQ